MLKRIQQALCPALYLRGAHRMISVTVTQLDWSAYTTTKTRCTHCSKGA